MEDISRVKLCKREDDNMRIIHCADLHLDSKMETNLTAEQAKERRYEILSTFENMVEYAVQNDVKVIMIAGDLFDTAQNQQKTIKNRVLTAIKNARNIDFLYLQGNHDKDDFFKSLSNKPDNLKLFSQEWSGYTYDNIVITGIEFGKQDSSGIYSELILNENHFNIIVMHGQVSQYRADNKEEVINLSALQNKYIDYLALGHIHEYKCEKLDYRGIYCYSGCLEGRGFDECGKKGFVVLDIKDNKIVTEFVSQTKRTMHEIQVDLTNMTDSDEIIEKVEKEIREVPKKDLLKVVLKGEILEETDIDISYLEQKMKKQFYFFKIVDKTELKIDYFKYENDISLKGEFIRKVKNLSISDEEKSKIMIMGIRALIGKEVK